jgi:hypothetical protein
MIFKRTYDPQLVALTAAFLRVKFARVRGGQAADSEFDMGSDKKGRAFSSDTPPWISCAGSPVTAQVWPGGTRRLSLAPPHDQITYRQWPSTKTYPSCL